MLIHALLFASPEPLGVDRLATLSGATRDEVRAALRQIGAYYASGEAPGGVMLQEIARGWQLTTAPQAAQAVIALGRGRPQPLSPAALETLAIIAYRQPATRADVEAIRGVKIDGVLATLLDRDLVREVGRKQAPGRPVLYGITDEFLRFFGLRSLDDLPQPAPEDTTDGREAELPVAPA